MQGCLGTLHLLTWWKNVWQKGEGNQPPTGKQRSSGRLLLPDWWPLRCSPLVGWVFKNCYLERSFLEAVQNLLFELHSCIHVKQVRFAKWHNLSLFAAYKNLQSRQETRNLAWQKDGWDSTVYYTGRKMETSFVLRNSTMTV